MYLIVQQLCLHVEGYKVLHPTCTCMATACTDKSKWCKSDLDRISK